MSNRRFYKYPSAETVAARKADLFAANEGLEAALATPHRIIADIRQRLDTWGKLSEAQIALVIRLAREATERQAERDAEVKAAAPEGKVTFTGKIVSLKWKAGYAYNSPEVPKITVKVTTDAGVWLAWGTCPQAVFDAQDREHANGRPEIVGATITLTATTAQGNDAHFALFKRPKLQDITWNKRAEAPKAPSTGPDRVCMTHDIDNGEPDCGDDTGACTTTALASVTCRECLDHACA